MQSVKPPTVEDLLHELRAQFDDHHALDSLLREIAQGQLRILALERQMAELLREMTLLKTFQRAHDLLVPAAAMAYAGRRYIRVHAGMPLPPSLGLHIVERDGSGRPFRWTGPGPTFHFDVHLDRSVPIAFALRLAWNSDAHCGMLRCFSDGIEIPLVRNVMGMLVERCGVLFPRDMLGLTRVEFTVERTFRPDPGVGEAADPRELGVAFREIEFKEATSEQIDAMTSAEVPSAGERSNEVP